MTVLRCYHVRRLTAVMTTQRGSTPAVDDEISPVGGRLVNRRSVAGDRDYEDVLRG